MVLGLKPMGKLDTYRKIEVVDRTKALHGPRTQACGKTIHTVTYGYWTESRYCMVFGLKFMAKLDTYKKIEVVDRTKVLHGSRTRIYGENKYLEKNQSVT